jgi:antitoxin component of RelBE/YafQ-DinJ toxin-antitoxin module
VLSTKLKDGQNLNLGLEWTKIVHNMSTVQLKVTISDRLQILLKNQAENLGLSMAAYIKNLIIEDIKKNDLPSKMASQEIEKSYESAIKNKKSAKKIDNLDEFLTNL